MRVGVDRPFLDANVLFSAAYLPESRLRKLWSLPRVKLVSSAFAIEEARRNLAAYRPEALSLLDELCAPLTLAPETQVAPPFPDGIELPEKDRPILAAAIAARCTHLLTGDARHFGALYGRTIGGVLVLAPAEYFRRRSRAGRRRRR